MDVPTRFFASAPRVTVATLLPRDTADSPWLPRLTAVLDEYEQSACAATCMESKSALRLTSGFVIGPNHSELDAAASSAEVAGSSRCATRLRRV